MHLKYLNSVKCLLLSVIYLIRDDRKYDRKRAYQESQSTSKTSVDNPFILNVVD